jgi:hypothetical protein
MKNRYLTEAEINVKEYFELGSSETNRKGSLTDIVLNVIKSKQELINELVLVAQHMEYRASIQGSYGTYKDYYKKIVHVIEQQTGKSWSELNG